MYLFYISTPISIYIYSGLFVTVLDYEYLTIFLSGNHTEAPLCFHFAVIYNPSTDQSVEYFTFNTVSTDV